MLRLRALPLLLLFVALPASCQELPPAIPCGEIPEGGCPLGRGGSCDDPACPAIYDCLDGTWSRVRSCNASDAGPDGDAGSDGGEAQDGGVCTPSGIDTKGESVDCMPDLEAPDCPVEAAEPCKETACSTGCLDFFLCTKDGWIDVAYCTDDGLLVVTP